MLSGEILFLSIAYRILARKMISDIKFYEQPVIPHLKSFTTRSLDVDSTKGIIFVEVLNSPWLVEEPEPFEAVFK